MNCFTNRQLVACCQFGLVFLNRQLNRQLVSESLTGDREGFGYDKDRGNVCFGLGKREAFYLLSHNQKQIFISSEVENKVLSLHFLHSFSHFIYFILS